MRVIWTNEALDRLSEIEDYIARDSPGRAETFVNHLIAKGNSLTQNPRRGRIVQEISHPDIREIITKNYRFVYRIKSDMIEILTVFEGHQLFRTEEFDFDSEN